MLSHLFLNETLDLAMNAVMTYVVTYVHDRYANTCMTCLVSIPPTSRNTSETDRPRLFLVKYRVFEYTVVPLFH